VTRQKADYAKIRAQGPLAVELTPAGITRRAALSVASVSWEGVLRIVRTDDDILFYFYTQQLFRMPRRVFATPEREREFLSAAEAWRNAGHQAQVPGAS
jgi:hypothetical protein